MFLQKFKNGSLVNMKNKIILDTPTQNLVKKYIEKYNSNEDYLLVDRTITKLISHFRENKIIEDILIKTSVINNLYRTNIYSVNFVAEHIHSIADIDSLLKEGDKFAVDKIAKTIINDKTRNFYSFATKYCHFHEPEKYPIFDSFVELVLVTYRDQYKFYNFKNKDLREYGKFCAILTKFIESFNLENFKLKEIDKFLWMYGKESFSNQDSLSVSSQ